MIMVQKGQYFEPIVGLEDRGNEYKITRRFRPGDSSTPQGLASALRLIGTNVLARCSPQPSMPQSYLFKEPAGAERTLHAIRMTGASVSGQVIGRSGQTIGIVADGCLVPCMPSPVISNGPRSVSIAAIQGVPLDKTVRVLQALSSKLPVAPAFKVVEGDKVEGILTESNQFVPGMPENEIPEIAALPLFKSPNIFAVDEAIADGGPPDSERVESLHQLKTDTDAYNAFRRRARTLLGDFTLYKEREAIQRLVDSPPSEYDSVLRDVRDAFVRLLDDSVKFDDVDKVMETDDLLTMPRYSLTNGSDNQERFFYRIADEAIRYTRIKAFLFNPKAFLATSPAEYSLGENEIILLQSLLTGKPDYFEGLVPLTTNAFIRRNTFQTAQPLLSQSYNSEALEVEEMDPMAEPPDTQNCPRPSLSKGVAGAKWHSQFPVGSKEVIFPNEPANCTFELPLYLIRQHDALNSHYTADNLREVLAAEYEALNADHKGAIHRVLAEQGKRSMMERVGKGSITMTDLVTSSEYFMTNLDLWIIAERFDIPLVLYAGTKLRENGLDLLVVNSLQSASLTYFVKSPAPQADSIPNKYRLLVLPPSDSLVDVARLSPALQQRILKGERWKSVSDFLTSEQALVGKRKKLKVID